jgi:hypothetical protein
VYQKLGKTLSEWKQWKRFLNGFDPKLFRIAGIAQTNFLRDASLLHQFVEKIEAAKHQRLTARVTSGERDIIAPGGVVHSYQNSVARSRELQTGDYNKIKDNLREIFPDLRDLHY